MYNFVVNAQVRDWATSGCLVDVGGVEGPSLKCLEGVFGNIVFMC